MHHLGLTSEPCVSSSQGRNNSVSSFQNLEQKTLNYLWIGLSNFKKSFHLQCSSKQRWMEAVRARTNELATSCCRESMGCSRHTCVLSSSHPGSNPASLIVCRASVPALKLSHITPVPLSKPFYCSRRSHS